MTAASLAGPAPAWSQEGGVFIDPDSPGGKEYALPVDQARHDFSTAERGDRVSSLDPASGPAPLFGRGISQSSARPEKTTRKRNSKTPSTSTVKPREVVDEAVARLGASPNDGWAMWAALAGIPLALLAAGTLAGVAIARRNARRR